MTKVKKNILSKLKKHLEPSFIEVIDESHLHANHNPDAKNGGTHFKVKIISKTFQDKSNIEKHRIVYEILDSELKKKHREQTSKAFRTKLY